jgi:hypothetical protein
MEIQDTNICICQHDFQDHFLDLDGQVTDTVGDVCYLCYPFGNECLKFKLDNLAYLEQKANDRI